MKRSAILLVALAGCSQEKAPTRAAPPHDLEAAAVRAGIVADPASTDITGLYARDTDRLCILPGQGGYRVGVSVRFDEEQGCTARGVGDRSGDRLDIAFPDCRIAAQFDGERISFPATLPPGCAALCSSRATLSALDVEQQSGSAAEAATLRDVRGHLLCVS